MGQYGIERGLLLERDITCGVPGKQTQDTKGKAGNKCIGYDYRHRKVKNVVIEHTENG
jgi:hypothetical protein